MASSVIDEKSGDLRTLVEAYVPVADTPDTVNPVDGNLWIKQKDLSLSGSGGMDITIWRTYSVARASAGLTTTQAGSYRQASLGPGWSVDAAPKLSIINEWLSDAGIQSETHTRYSRNLLVDMCTTNKSHQQSRASNLRHILAPIGPDPILELADGTSEKLYSLGNHIAVTKSNWRLTCVNNLVTVFSPSGIKYNFGNISERKIGLYYINYDHAIPVDDFPFVPRTETYMLAKTATDLHGNQLSFTYKTLGKPIPLWTMPGFVEQPSAGLFVFPDNYGGMSAFERPATVIDSITSSDGRLVNFSYDTKTGKLTSISANDGTLIRYEYLAPNALNVRVLNKVTLANGDTWKFDYYPGPYVEGSKFIPLTPTNLNARKLKSLTNPSGGVTSYAYGALTSSVLIEEKHRNRILRTGREHVVQRTESTGGQWNYTYTKGRNGNYDTTTIDGPEGTTTMKFVGAAYKTVLLFNSPGAENIVWRVGTMAEKVDPAGGTQTFTWKQRLITPGKDFIVDLGYAMDTNIYAADLESVKTLRDGLAYAVTYSNHDAYGNPSIKTETGPHGEVRTTHLTWHNDTTQWLIGFPKEETSPNRSLNYLYDTNGKLIRFTRNGAATDYTYDNKGNLASKKMPTGHLYTYSNYKYGIAQNETQPAAGSVTRLVDDAGNITSITDAEGHTTSYTYDELKRITSKTPPRGNVQTFAYTPTSLIATRGNLVESIQYDPFGRMIDFVRGGITTRYEYDALGRRTFVSAPDSNEGTHYQYDAIGRVTRITSADDTYQTMTYGPATRTLTDERNLSTTYTYRGYGDPEQLHLMAISAPEPSANVSITRDSADRVTSVSQGGHTRTYSYNANGYLTSIANPETGTTTYGRDIAGNMTSRQVGNSGVTTFTYDGQYRQTGVIYPGNAHSISRIYDKTGKLVASNSPTGNHNLAYDAAGNLVSQTLTLDDKTFTARYTYNDNDQLTSTTYPQSNRMVSYSPDALGRPTTVSGYVDNVTYWPSGMVRQITYANGTKSSYEQNARLWPASFTTARSAGETYLSSTYSYDGTGNLTSISDSIDSNFNRTLGYDAIHRLTSAAGFWGPGNFSYDGGGNLLKQSFGSNSLDYTYDSQNRLAAITGLRAANLGYDAYGNVAISGNNTYTYNDVPNLVCINCAIPDQKVEYQYDGLNHRTSVSSAGHKTYEMHDRDGKQLIELDGDRLTEYFYLGDKRIAQRVSP